MIAHGGDILAWLDDAISRREKTARAVGWDTVQSGEYLWDTKYLILRRGDESLVTTELDPNLAEHVALNDPASVLRRCAADRKLLALHNTPGVIFPDAAYMDDNRWCVGCGFGNDGEALTPEVNDCPTLNALAEGYGWTGGER